ncbi:hypothetical protein Tco_1009129 [Tanacetum coccineum]
MGDGREWGMFRVGDDRYCGWAWQRRRELAGTDAPNPCRRILSLLSGIFAGYEEGSSDSVGQRGFGASQHTGHGGGAGEPRALGDIGGIWGNRGQSNCFAKILHGVRFHPTRIKSVFRRRGGAAWRDGPGASRYQPHSSTRCGLRCADPWGGGGWTYPQMMMSVRVEKLFTRSPVLGWGLNYALGER